jgi:hypothetical protein
VARVLEALHQERGHLVKQMADQHIHNGGIKLLLALIVFVLTGGATFGFMIFLAYGTGAWGLFEMLYGAYLHLKGANYTGSLQDLDHS